MSAEVFLFVLMGAVAIAAAVAMLLQTNAVHSALFLILNFVCIAVLFVLLDASFLALVQIAVYAGAIMVLFLFVIMLLGAEKIGGEDVREFHWLPPVALTLAMSLLLAVSLAVIQGQIDSREIPEDAPMVRIAHFAAAYEEPVDIYFNDELVASEVDFRETTSFEELEAGEYTIGLGISGTEQVLPLTDVITLEDGQIATVLAFGDGRIPEIATVSQDFSTMHDREGRVLFFNALTGVDAVTFLDPGSDFIVEEGEAVDIYAEDIPYGTVAEVAILAEGEQRLAAAEGGNIDNIIYTLREFEVERATTTLFVLSGEPVGVAEGFVSFGDPIVNDTDPQFGGPASVGQSLFTRYVLPFQMVGMLLLSAMVGAIVLTQRADIKPKPGRPTRRKVSRPLTSVIASQTGSDFTVDAPRLEPPEEDREPEPAGD